MDWPIRLLQKGSKLFFNLSAQPKTNFSNFYQLGNLHLSTDAGWQEIQVGSYQVVYKGYADIASLEELLDQIVVQHEPFLLGNFCAIVRDVVKDTVRIQTDRYRSFPIYILKTNIQLTI